MVRKPRFSYSLNSRSRPIDNHKSKSIQFFANGLRPNLSIFRIGDFFHRKISIEKSLKFELNQFGWTKIRLRVLCASKQFSNNCSLQIWYKFLNWWNSVLCKQEAETCEEAILKNLSDREPKTKLLFVLLERFYWEDSTVANALGRFC